MSLETKLVALAQAIGADVKTLTDKAGRPDRAFNHRQVESGCGHQ